MKPPQLTVPSFLLSTDDGGENPTFEVYLENLSCSGPGIVVPGSDCRNPEIIPLDAPDPMIRILPLTNQAPRIILKPAMIWEVPPPSGAGSGGISVAPDSSFSEFAGRTFASWAWLAGLEEQLESPGAIRAFVKEPHQQRSLLQEKFLLFQRPPAIVRPDFELIDLAEGDEIWVDTDREYHFQIRFPNLLDWEEVVELLWMNFDNYAKAYAEFRLDRRKAPWEPSGYLWRANACAVLALTILDYDIIDEGGHVGWTMADVTGSNMCNTLENQLGVPVVCMELGYRSIAHTDIPILPEIRIPIVELGLGDLSLYGSIWGTLDLGVAGGLSFDARETDLDFGSINGYYAMLVPAAGLSLEIGGVVDLAVVELKAGVQTCGGIRIPITYTGRFSLEGNEAFVDMDDPFEGEGQVGVPGGSLLEGDSMIRTCLLDLESGEISGEFQDLGRGDGSQDKHAALASASGGVALAWTEHEDRVQSTNKDRKVRLATLGPGGSFAAQSVLEAPGASHPVPIVVDDGEGPVVHAEWESEPVFEDGKQAWSSRHWKSLLHTCLTSRQGLCQPFREIGWATFEPAPNWEAGDLAGFGHISVEEILEGFGEVGDIFGSTIIHGGYMPLEGMRPQLVDAGGGLVNVVFAYHGAGSFSDRDGEISMVTVNASPGQGQSSPPHKTQPPLRLD